MFLSHLFLITGSSTAKALRMLKLMNVACISERTFYRHTRFYVNPVVIQEWCNHQQQLLDDLAEREGGLVVAGDGRCDSPGYCAKFGSFTFMEQQINRVVDFQLVQVSTYYLPGPLSLQKVPFPLLYTSYENIV